MGKPTESKKVKRARERRGNTPRRGATKAPIVKGSNRGHLPKLPDVVAAPAKSEVVKFTAKVHAGSADSPIVKVVKSVFVIDPHSPIGQRNQKKLYQVRAALEATL